MSDNSSSTVLRRESHWLTWSGMTTSQQEAFGSIVHAFRDAVERSDQIAKKRKTPDQAFFDAPPERPNKTLLITGDRGTGKSSLLMSLAHATVRDWRPILRTDRRQADLPEGIGQIEQDLKSLETRLVWLDPLDMELQEKHTNLLAAILTRVEIALERIRDVSEHATELLRGMTSQSEQAIVELSRLMSDVSAGWDGNLPQRAGSLDPDSYATEVLRVERARADLTQRFGSVLEKLSEHFPWPRTIQRPLFVLPIDDFDLNPSQCLNILRMIRMLHHSPNNTRLVSVVLGDIEIAKKMLMLRTLGERARMSEIKPDPQNFKHFILDDLHEFTSEALRKLLPPAQRSELVKMKSEEILNFRPNADADRLFELLDRLPFRFISVQGSKRIRSLLDFLVGTPFNNGEDLPEGDASRQNYAGSASRHKAIGTGLLADYDETYSVNRHQELSLRHVVDMWHRLPGIVPPELLQKQEEPSDSLKKRLIRSQNFLVDLYCEALEADLNLADLLDDEEVHLGLKNVLKLRTTREGKRWSLNQGVVRVGCRLSGELAFGSLRARDVCHTASDVAGFLRVWRSGEWWLAAETPRTKELREFQQQTNCMFMLTHDVFALSRTFPLENSATPNPADVKVATTVWRIKPAIQVEIEWLAPRFRAFWGWDHLKTAWFDAVGEFCPVSPYEDMGPGETRRLRSDVDLTELAYRWMLIGTAILDQQQFPLKSNPTDDKLHPDWSKPFSKSDPAWDELMERLKQLLVAVAQRVSESDGNPSSAMMIPTIESWVIGLCHLACPESGLPTSVIERLWPTIEPIFVSKELAAESSIERVVQRRQELALRFINEGADELAWDLFRPSARGSLRERRQKQQLEAAEERELPWLEDAIFVVGETVERVGAKRLLAVRRTAKERSEHHFEDVLKALGYKEPEFDRPSGNLPITDWHVDDLPKLASALRIIERYLKRPKSRTVFRVSPYDADDVAGLLREYPKPPDEAPPSDVKKPSDSIPPESPKVASNLVNDFENGILCPSEDWLWRQIEEREERRRKIAAEREGEQ